MRNRALLLAGASLLALTGFAGNGWAAASSTAQSIMAQLSGGGLYALVYKATYRFNTDGETAFYSNTLTSGPAVTCAGSAANCGAANQPATPNAPAPAVMSANSGNGQISLSGVSVADFNKFADVCTFLT